MWNPYQYDRSASAQVKTVLYDCSNCGRLFEPLAPWDNFCDECWNEMQSAMVEELAERAAE